MTAEVNYNARVTYRQDLHEALWIVRVAPLAGEVPEFVPGQYAELGLVVGERLTRRAYSIASPARERSFLEFFIALVPEGQMTPLFHELHVDAPVWLNTKVKGKFTLNDIPAEKDLILVSTGTGIAPFVSMLQEYMGQGRWRRCVIINGSRYARDLAYQSEIAEVQRQDPSVSYLATVTREPADSAWTGLRGRVQQLFEPEAFRELTGFDLNPQTSQIMMCGNPDMIDSLTEQLERQGFSKHSKKQPGQIHFERYW